MNARSTGRTLSRLAFILAALAALAIAAAGPGTRFGLWPFRTAFTVMRWGTYLALGAAALSLVALVVGGARAAAAGALALALGAFAGPWLFMRTARSVPPIHDISTDTADPPGFVAVLARRSGAANPPEYAGEVVAAQQRQAYPDVQPLRMAVPPAQAFERAVQAAREMGWEIVAAVPGDGRIEATDTTRWFGFKDDVVVRVRADGPGSRIDVRSKSRVGRSDVGANARRIRAFLDRVRTG
ncbi:MAG TPA: DUF1499 domain-containing protein [Vicinamibacteria bacterium]|nr:DUF1499 domain-containing protein [Vicinamibacteria bacterium]